MSILGNVEFGSVNLHGNLSSEATFIILTNNSNRAALAQINITEPINTSASHWAKCFIGVKWFSLTLFHGVCTAIQVYWMALKRRGFSWTDQWEKATKWRGQHWDSCRMTPPAAPSMSYHMDATSQATHPREAIDRKWE